jgi:ribosomal-protein-alanine N-acetyltransferase
MYPEQVETAHLRGVRITEADYPRLRELHTHPDVMRTLGGLRSEAATRSVLERLMLDWQTDGFGWWWLWDKATGASAGHGGLRRTQVEGKPEVEVGYALLPPFWGKGYATEVARLSVDLARSELRLAEIVCFTLTTNLASQRVMQKAGFVYEKDIVHAGLPHVLYRQRLAGDSNPT